MGQDNSSPEVMLAQEQAVIRRGPGARKAVEAAFGFGGESEGTLVLTDRRLVFVDANEKEEDIPVSYFVEKKLYFSDVETLDAIPLDEDQSSVEIPISSIVKVAGRRGEGLDPRLVVTWSGEKGAARSTEFIQQVTGGSRRKNLNDWAKVVERLKGGQLKVLTLPPPPGQDTLEGRILAVLGDMQQKGLFMVESEVEEKFKLDLEPDEVEAACDRLVSAGLVRKFNPKDEDSSYLKVSPLGGDDLGV